MQGFERVARLSELSWNRGKRYRVGTRQIVLIRVKPDHVYALDYFCYRKFVVVLSSSQTKCSREVC